MNLKSSFLKPDKPIDDPLLPVNNVKNEKDRRLTMAKMVMLVSLCVMLAISLTIFSLFYTSSSVPTLATVAPCMDTCKVELVESIPDGLVFNSTVNHTSTYSAWSKLISLAEKEIQLAGMYWTLRGQDFWSDPSDWAGESVYQQLRDATKEKGLRLRIAQNLPPARDPNLDTEDLAREVGAEVRSLNFKELMGTGILHTKLWVVDGKHFYVGSANFDWRSLTQVKELGVLVRDCPCLAEDMSKIWSVYWDLGGQTKIPPTWPDSYTTKINSDSPLSLPTPALSVYLSSSPPPFCPPGREVDIDAILKTINSAEHYVHIAVMDYFPTTIYTPHPTFWPVIDDALRAAAINRGVSVRLLISHWAHTRPAITRYLTSLTSLSGTKPKVDIQVKMFTVPAFTPAQQKIPFGRVNHNKYMVTDKQGYIGTSNWSGDYFISTGGVGFVFTGQMREQLEEVFNRDWTSQYAGEIRGGEEEVKEVLYNHYEEL